MSDAYGRAKTAQQRGQHGVAQEHRQRGDAHKSSMESLDERAANIFFRENNKVSNKMDSSRDQPTVVVLNLTLLY